MFEWEDVIRRETEQPFATKFEKKDGSAYQYFILPLERRLTANYLEAVNKGLAYMLLDELSDANVLLLPEAKAFLLTGLAQEAGLTVVPTRKRDYRVPYQIWIEQTKAYEDGSPKNMYCTGLKPGDKPLLVDDMISSGGTEIAIARALDKCGFRLVGIASVYDREDGVKTIEKEVGYRAKSLARLENVDGAPRVTKFYRR